MLELNLSIIGWLHTFACIVAMLAFVPVMLARKGSRRHRASGRAYSIAYLVGASPPSPSTASSDSGSRTGWRLEDSSSWASGISRHV